MWRVYRQTVPSIPWLSRASLLESLTTMSRRAVLLLGSLALLQFILASTPRPGNAGWQMLAITLAWLGVCAVVYHLAARRLLLAHILLVGAAAPLLVCAVWASGQPLLVILYAGLPLLAVAFIGWSAGLAALIFTAVVPGLMAAAGAAPPLSGDQAFALTALALGVGLLTWIIVNALMGLAESALLGLEHAQTAVDEARGQRLELKQVEEDLLQATREQARLLDRLKAMNQVAEEARQAKQEFIAKVSHELRTPLNMIIAYSELITQSPKLYGGRIPPALLADMVVILRNSQHLSKLVDDVLDLSQIDAGRMALSKTWADMAEIVREATEAVRPLFQTKGLYLQVMLPPDPPPIYCDPMRVRQVLMNLLSNAGRFTTEGGVHVRVWVEDEQMRFSVWDSGPGIDPRDREHLFEPFQQIDASIRRKHGGSGLGLSISKQFVEMHEGRIWLESQPGQGTVFHVSLPLAALPPDEPVAARRWVHPYNTYTPRTRPRIAPVPEVKARYVVMEHGRTLERLLSRFLENVEVVRVQSLEEALHVLSESPARALVINSALLPRAAWPDNSIGRLPFDTPLLACWLPGDSATERGAKRYLVKPVSSHDLQEAVHSLGPQVKTVLICDDEPDILRLFLRVLSGAPQGYRIVTATNGVEALAALRELRPDALVLDLLMPEMTGFDLLQEKEQDPLLAPIPVIVISSLDPFSQPIMSNQLFVARGGGLSLRDLLQCIQSLSAVLAPEPAAHPAAPAAPRV